VLKRLTWIAGFFAIACGSRTELDAPDATADSGDRCEGISLLVNCSFELPPAKSGGLQVFATGAQLPGWTVVGESGNVNTINTTFTQNGFAFPALEGSQSMDLTGFSNTKTGVSQTVATVAGTSYALAFWVGNISDPGGIFGVSSTIDVLVDGASVLSATTSDGGGTTTLAWKRFSLSFTASSSSTTIAFMNADKPNDTSNFVDDVLLVAKP
jgi:hypothetical protein